MASENAILLVEPFYTGSHRQLMDLLHAEIPGCSLVTMTGKKWHWRARTGALYLSQTIPQAHSFRTLFASSVLNLAELIALRPDLSSLKKVLYFHENQLTYPVQSHKQRPERDFQYGYNQILSCLVADQVLFNSEYNMKSFLANIKSFFKLVPDHRPSGLADQILPKCCVVHFPIAFPETVPEESPVMEDQTGRQHVRDQDIPGRYNDIINKDSALYETQGIGGRSSVLSDCASDRVGVNKNHCAGEMELCVQITDCFPSDSSSDILNKVICDTEDKRGGLNTVECEKQLHISAAKRLKRDDEPLHIVWPHRWEHDKNPEAFFKAMLQLQETGCDFRLSVIGDQYSEVPAIFEEARSHLKDRVRHWGYQKTRGKYFRVLQEADVVVSTANHEFFGVAMLEAVHCGCYPLVPNRLVYPEIFPDENVYTTDNQLFKRLREFCRNPNMLRRKEIKMNTEKYSWASLRPQFLEILGNTEIPAATTDTTNSNIGKLAHNIEPKNDVGDI